MKTPIATICFVVGTALIPMAANAQDGDTDRSHPVTFVKDSAITTKVKAMLADEKMSSLAHIQVDTDNKGQVYLSGTVDSRKDADKAVEITRSIKGVTSVKSDLKVKTDK